MAPQIPRGFEEWMNLALAEARGAAPAGDVPVGALVLDEDGAILASARNERERRGDPTAHAEVLALREAAEVSGGWRLERATLVVTLEPCTMCAGAILSARIPRVVFGAWEPKTGAAGSLYDVLRDRRLGRPVEVYAGVREAACASLLADFFASRRPADGVATQELGWGHE